MLAAMTRFVLTLKVDLNANARRDTTAIPFMVCVRPLSVDALQTRSAALTRNAFSQESAFARRLSSSMLEIFVEARAKDSLAALMPNVVRLIRLNVCARLVSREIRCKAASAPTNVPMPLALMELNV